MEEVCVMSLNASTIYIDGSDIGDRVKSFKKGKKEGSHGTSGLLF